MKRAKKGMVSNQAFSQRLAHRWKCNLGACLQSIHHMMVVVEVGVHSFAVLDSMIPVRTQMLMGESATIGS